MAKFLHSIKHHATVAQTVTLFAYLYWEGIKLRGLSPRANYTDREAAAGQRSSANFCG